MAKVWAVSIDGKTMHIGSLSPEEIDQIATRCDVNWLILFERPLTSIRVAKELVDVAAKHLGVAVPVLATARELYDAFDMVDDDLPAEYADGIPKEAPAATETTG